MIDTIVTITSTGLASLLNKFRSFTSQADQIIQDKMLESVKENIVAVAKSLVPKKTGALQASIDAITGDDPLSVLLVAQRNYSRWLEYGERAHTIEAKNAKALAFKIGGRLIFAKSVWHPGIPPHPFLTPAIEAGKEKVASDIASAIIGS